MDHNNILKNQIQIKRFKKKLYLKKACKTCVPGHETEINRQRIKDNHKTSLYKKIMQSNEIKKNEPKKKDAEPR